MSNPGCLHCELLRTLARHAEGAGGSYPLTSILDALAHVSADILATVPAAAADAALPGISPCVAQWLAAIRRTAAARAGAPSGATLQ
jgi:hypothetical protein